MSIIRIVSTSLLISLLFTIPVKADSGNTNQADNSPRSDTPLAREKQKKLKRVSENGGEVIIDGSLKVLEPVMGKIFDVVETTEPVTPASNHARLYVVAKGTYTILKVMFDDGVVKVLTNN